MPLDDEPDDPFARDRSRRTLAVRGLLGVAVLGTVGTLGLGGVRASAMRTSTSLAIEEARVHPNRSAYLHPPSTDEGYRYTPEEVVRVRLLAPSSSFIVTRPYWAISGDCTEVQVSDGSGTTKVFLHLERESMLHFEIRGPASKGDCD